MTSFRNAGGYNCPMKKKDHDIQGTGLVPAADWAQEPSGAPEEFGLTPNATSEEKTGLGPAGDVSSRLQGDR